ncbi:anti-repressor SinI family protein [Fictibacillus fluitans]|uniref:Anti-repressor SinI family protein n=1 Tax=Fictibacillus fluitans TaxID=3058422 RepID=A0ABT8HZ39_9BACL|nr:anti-repressor SinI family protein [Fictibacillus sp. NE201]MDN4526011.1 anti-repressor SinI family protein [Fictibacillus sp. NE201]
MKQKYMVEKTKTVHKKFIVAAQPSHRLLSFSKNNNAQHARLLAYKTRKKPALFLDQEWVKLIHEAKQMGLSLDEVRSFILCPTQ